LICKKWPDPSNYHSIFALHTLNLVCKYQSIRLLNIKNNLTVSSHVVLCYLQEAIFVHILITIISMWLYVRVCQLLEAGGWRGACIGHCEVATVVSSAFIKVSKYVYTWLESWGWTQEGTRNKTWPMAISGNLSSSAKNILASHVEHLLSLGALTP
jgi:hypothetical protein